jgi:hypothetical protein
MQDDGLRREGGHESTMVVALSEISIDVAQATELTGTLTALEWDRGHLSSHR